MNNQNNEKDYKRKYKSLKLELKKIIEEESSDEEIDNDNNENLIECVELTDLTVKDLYNHELNQVKIQDDIHNVNEIINDITNVKKGVDFVTGITGTVTKYILPFVLL